MIAAVFDTNVLVSGVLAPDGSPGKLLEAMLGGLCQPVVTDAILAEYEDTMNRPKFRFSASRSRALLDGVRAYAAYAPYAPVGHAAALPDPDDDVIFLEAAFGLNVPIVTGNIGHFPKHLAKHISVFSPAASLAQLSA